MRLFLVAAAVAVLAGPAAAPAANTAFDAMTRGNAAGDTVGGGPPSAAEALDGPPPRDRPVPDMKQIQKAWDDAVPAPGQYAPGAMRFRLPGRPGAGEKVMRIRSRLHMGTLITLPACETVESIVLADDFAFDARAESSRRVFVAPRMPGADSALHITSGSGRRYSFYIRAETVDAEWPPDVTVDLVANVPGTLCDDGDGEAASTPPDFAETHPVNMDAMDLRTADFAAFVERPEDAGIAPDAIAHDGRRMFLYYTPERMKRVRWPVVYLREDGVDRQVNARVTGRHDNIIAVPAVGELTLRGSNRVVCIRRRPDAVDLPGGVVVDTDLGRDWKGWRSP